jgi:hypothetical protein
LKLLLNIDGFLYFIITVFIVVGNPKITFAYGAQGDSFRENRPPGPPAKAFDYGAFDYGALIMVPGELFSTGDFVAAFLYLLDFLLVYHKKYLDFFMVDC